MNRRSVLRWLGGGAALAASDAALSQFPANNTNAPSGSTTPHGGVPMDGNHPAEAAVAQTVAGKVRGLLSDGVNVFKGIPYGASTAGANRFAPPRKPDNWDGIRDAVELGDRAPQNPSAGLLPAEAVTVANEPMSEDCLRLNVWTAGLRDGLKRPVMVWFHGGGYSSGSGGSPRYDGSNLAKRQGVVVVTVNHRLNVFGHLFLADIAGEEFADSGNAGMLDLVASLQWVRDNIAAFGGDPRNVTIFGESGGGGKVSTLMAMPAAAGLFHRAIAESGVALRQTPREVATNTAKAVLGKLGIPMPAAAWKLRTVPQADLLAAIAEMSPLPRFAPVVDGRSLPRNPFDPAAPDISANVPLLLGSNATEVTFLPDTPLDPIDAATLRERVKQYAHVDAGTADMLIGLYKHARPKISNEHLYQIMASDYWLTSDVTTQAERKAAAGKAPVYLYHFEWETPVRDGKLRSVHTLEIPFVFDTLAASIPLVGAGADRGPLAQTMSAAWARFARTGNPNGRGLPNWAPYSNATRSVMIFDKTCRAVNDPNRQERLAMGAVKLHQPA